MVYIFVDFDGSKHWFEVGEDGYALRQITIDEKYEKLISCRQPCLADQIVDTEYDCEVITESDFESVWYDAIKELQPIWQIEKKKYPIGQNIKGIVKYFYPQGTIIDLGKIQGCANTKNCSVKKRYKMSGIVNGYDEKNMWVLIDNCKII